MTTTNATFNPMQFIDDNFDYINLLMLAGLYIVCFIYLLQDTVKTVKTGFANMIGIFVGQFFFLLLATYIIPQEYSIFRYGTILTLILEFVSSFILLLQYKNLQDANVDDDIVLQAKIAGVDYQLTGPYNIKDFYTNALISCDVIIAIFSAIFFKFSTITDGYLSTALNIAQYIIPTITLLLSSIMVYFASTAKPSVKPISKPSPAINSKTIPALIFICLLNVLFLLFISTIISRFDVVNSGLLAKLSWSSVFISSLFQIISIFMVIIPYKYLNDNYISKHIELSYSSLLNQELKDYNNLFVAVTTTMIVYVGALIYDKNLENNLYTQKNMFSDSIYYNGFYYGGGIAMLSMSSEMIKISNDFLAFKNNAPKNKSDNNLQTVNVSGNPQTTLLSS
jgi:hypothetical protein